MADTIRQLVIELGFKIDQSQIPKLGRQIDGATRKAQGMDKALSGALMRFAGPAALAAGVYKVAGAIDSASESAVQFGRDLAPLQTLLPHDPERVRQLGDEIQRLARETGSTTSEIAKATNDVLQVFDDSADTMKYVELALRGAKASGTDASTAFDLVSTSLLQFGEKGAAAAKHTMDMAFAMRQFGKIEISQFAHGMSEVAGTAHQLGVSQEELFGILGATAGITGPVDQSFTQLNSVINALETPTKDLQKLYNKLGITSIQAAVKQRGLFGVLKQIHAASDGTVESLNKLIPDMRAQRIAWPLVTTLAGRYAEGMRQVAESTDKSTEADKAFRGGVNKTGTELDVLTQKTETAYQRMGDGLKPLKVAWNEAWLAMVEFAGRQLEGFEDRLSGVVHKSDTFGERGDKAIATAYRLVPTVLGGGAAMLGTIGDANGPAERAAIRAAMDKRLQEAMINLSPEAQDRRVAQGGASLTAQAAAVARDINVTNNVQIQVPAGVEPAAFATLVQQQLDKLPNQVARNIRNASSGDNP